MKNWFRKDLAGFAREALLERNGGARSFFAGHEIEQVLAEHQRSDLSGPIYSLLVFDQWCTELHGPWRGLRTNQDWLRLGPPALPGAEHPDASQPKHGVGEPTDPRHAGSSGARNGNRLR